jgi:hypothetical protein
VFTTKLLTTKRTRDLLVGLRATFGVLALVAPGAVLRVLGLDPSRQPALIYLARVFAVRDVIMAHQLASASTEDEAEEAIRAGIVVDTSDTVAALAALATGRVTRRTAALGAAGALLGLGLGLAARRRAEPVGPSTAGAESKGSTGAGPGAADGTGPDAAAGSGTTPVAP